MKPREEYDKDVADLEQIGRNLFARRNIWFYLFMCVYILRVCCVHSGASGEKREERIKFKKVRHKRRKQSATTT